MTFTENEMHDWDVEYGPMDLKTVYLTKGCLPKKKSPYGGTLSQLGGEGVKINFKMSLLKIPFY